jgi:hypothetical protein
LLRVSLSSRTRKSEWGHIDHRRLTFKHQGLAMRLTGVEGASPVQGVLA